MLRYLLIFLVASPWHLITISLCIFSCINVDSLRILTISKSVDLCDALNVSFLTTYHGSFSWHPLSHDFKIIFKSSLVEFRPLIKSSIFRYNPIFIRRCWLMRAQVKEMVSIHYAVRVKNQ